jgi:hypothetical protein
VALVRGCLTALGITLDDLQPIAGTRAKISRPKRWQNAVAELEELQSEYQDWLDSIPENLQGSEKAEQLQAIVDIDLSELLGVDFPRMMG